MISSYVSAWKENVPNLTSTLSLSELLSESFGKPRLVAGICKLKHYDGGNSNGVLTSAQVNAQQTYLDYTKKTPAALLQYGCLLPIHALSVPINTS